MRSWRLIVLLTFALVRPAPGRDYFVAAGGSDDGPGTRARPLRTIGKAASVMRAGDWMRPQLVPWPPGGGGVSLAIEKLQFARTVAPDQIDPLWGLRVPFVPIR